MPCRKMIHMYASHALCHLKHSLYASYSRYFHINRRYYLKQFKVIVNGFTVDIWECGIIQIGTDVRTKLAYYCTVNEINESLSSSKAFYEKIKYKITFQVPGTERLRIHLIKYCLAIFDQPFCQILSNWSWLHLN